MLLVRVLTLLFLGGALSSGAQAELVQIRLDELETSYRWLRDTDSGEEFGGPVTVRFRIPDEAVAVRSVAVLVQGELHAGGQWSLGCPNEECGPLIWYTSRFEVSGPCVSIVHGEHYGYEPGPFLLFVEIDDCPDLDTYLGAEVEFTAWSHQVDRSPQHGRTPEPSVEVSNFVLQFELEFAVPGRVDSWGTLKARF